MAVFKSVLPLHLEEDQLVVTSRRDQLTARHKGSDFGCENSNFHNSFRLDFSHQLADGCQVTTANNFNIHPSPNLASPFFLNQFPAISQWGNALKLRQNGWQAVAAPLCHSYRRDARRSF
jgi:hypothetical protein